MRARLTSQTRTLYIRRSARSANRARLAGSIMCAIGSVTAPTIAQEPIEPEFIGGWAGPWNYAGVVDPTGCGNQFKEFSNAALLPIGRYAGYVLIVSRGCSGVTTEVWLFNPSNP